MPYLPHHGSCSFFTLKLVKGRETYEFVPIQGNSTKTEFHREIRHSIKVCKIAEHHLQNTPQMLLIEATTSNINKNVKLINALIDKANKLKNLTQEIIILCLGNNFVDVQVLFMLQKLKDSLTNIYQTTLQTIESFQLELRQMLEQNKLLKINDDKTFSAELFEYFKQCIAIIDQYIQLLPIPNELKPAHIQVGTVVNVWDSYQKCIEKLETQYLPVWKDAVEKPENINFKADLSCNIELAEELINFAQATNEFQCKIEYFYQILPTLDKKLKNMIAIRIEFESRTKNLLTSAEYHLNAGLSKTIPHLMNNFANYPREAVKDPLFAEWLHKQIKFYSKAANLPKDSSKITDTAPTRHRSASR